MNASPASHNSAFTQRFRARRWKTQRGVALFSALLMFALITILMQKILVSQQINLEKTHWLVHQAQAEEFVMGAEIYALALLEEHLASQDQSTEIENQATFFEFFEISHSFRTELGSVDIRILDAQRLINPNSIQQSSSFEPALSAMFAETGLDPKFGEALADWVDSDDETTGLSGAEDDYYQSLTPAYRAANQHMLDASELLLIRGFDPDAYLQLSPWLQALPAITKVNINTAPAEVFELLYPDLNGEQIISERNQTEERFVSVQAFMSSPVTAGVDLDPQIFAVESNYFEFNIQVSLGGLNTNLSSIYQFDSESAEHQLISRTYKNNFR